MNDTLISQFLDDELGLDEKLEFVEVIHKDRAYKDLATALLIQEKQLQEPLAAPPGFLRQGPGLRTKRPIWRFWIVPLGGLAAALVTLFMVYLPGQNSQPLNRDQPHRFVIYLPEAKQAAVIGNFTGWHPVSLQRVGSSGYWSLTLNLPEGEHRYSYLIEESRQIADPTVASRELDDFGGENSIIQVGNTI